MTALLISAVFCILAGFFVAVMDRVENRSAFDKSVFKNLTPKFWCKSESWKYVSFLPFTKYRPDAWHLAKTFSIGCYALGFGVPQEVYTWWIVLSLKVALSVLSFNFFYNKALVKK